MAVTLRYFTEFGKPVFQQPRRSVAEFLDEFVVFCSACSVYECRRKESSRSLSHLLMSFLCTWLWLSWWLVWNASVVDIHRLYLWYDQCDVPCTFLGKLGDAVSCYVCNSGDKFEGDRCLTETLDEGLLKNCTDEGLKDAKEYKMCRKFIQDGKLIGVYLVTP